MLIILSIVALVVISLSTALYFKGKQKDADRILRKHGLSNVSVTTQDDQHLFD